MKLLDPETKMPFTYRNSHLGHTYSRYLYEVAHEINGQLWFTKVYAHNRVQAVNIARKAGLDVVSTCLIG